MPGVSYVTLINFGLVFLDSLLGLVFLDQLWCSWVCIDVPFSFLGPLGVPWSALLGLVFLDQLWCSWVCIDVPFSFICPLGVPRDPLLDLVFLTSRPKLEMHSLNSLEFMCLLGGVGLTGLTGSKFIYVKTLQSSKLMLEKQGGA
jgi:hypothetical protein